MHSDGAAMLAISPDGSRIATPNFAWKTSGAEYIGVRQLYESHALVLSTNDRVRGCRDRLRQRNELWRISKSDDSRDPPRLEDCHARSVEIELPALARCGLLCGDDIGVVVEVGDEIRFGRVATNALTLETLLRKAGPARAISCADDGSAFAVDLGDVTHLFDASGRAITTLTAPSTVRAVAPGGAALACVVDQRLAIVRSVGTVYAGVGVADQVAFSRDGASVACATSTGFAVVDASTGDVRYARQDLVSYVAALAFAPDRTLLTLGRDGQITEWAH